MGIRFQTNQKKITGITHVRFSPIEARLQQEVLGLIGVNLIYGASAKK